MIVTVNHIFYFSLAGFLLSLTTLLYFSAVYRQTFGSAANGAGRRITPSPDILVKNIENEINSFKLSIEDMKISLDKKKEFQQEQIQQIVSEINGLVLQIEGLKPEYVEKIDAPLNALICELENMRKNHIETETT